MAEIQKLPTDISNLIAAGEVVERPAAVVKELIENAIDAGATQITLEIRGGGVEYIRVTDNGKGMHPEDVPTAFLRHATSKVISKEDLLAIRTLGFRGEALAAIAAVSKIDIFTKQTAAPVGVQMTLEGGEQVELMEAGCPDGTTIIVRELFYNTPARMKFLKNDRTEAGHISGIVEHLAISRPNIGFKLLKDGRTVFSTVGDGNLEKAIYSVYGNEFSGGMIAVSGSEAGVGLSGCISPVSLTRANKNMQNFFINGRYVQSRLLYVAVERAYQGRLMTGRMPVCFLNLTMPYMNVDVNVHPTKLEVKFANEKKIFDVVYNLLTDALNAAEGYSATAENNPFISSTPANPVNPNDVTTYPTAAFTGGKVETASSAVTQFYSTLIADIKSEEKSAVKQLSFTENDFNDPRTFAEPAMQKPPKLAEPLSVATASPYTAPANLQTNTPAATPAKTVDTPHTEPKELTREAMLDTMVSRPKVAVTPYRIIGEAFKTYIIIEQEGILKLIDKHAVHEKMVYNRLKVGELHYFGQALLEPVAVTLTREEKGLLTDNLSVFTDLGFEAEDMGANLVSVRRAPNYIKHSDIAATITQILDKIATLKYSYGDLIEDILKSISCKSAVKAGFINVHEELHVLVEAVMTQPGLTTCPHGRPTMVELTQYQVEKLFKRA